jgi:hypothetical protein
VAADRLGDRVIVILLDQLQAGHPRSREELETVCEVGA